MGVLLGATILGVLIFLHELGHFSVAKLCGIGVQRFSIGFGKVLFSRQFGETEYAISMLPFGGYVKFFDDDPSNQVAPEKAFRTQSALKRFAVLIAGPGANLIVGVVLYVGGFLFFGFPHNTGRIGSVTPDSPAYRSGLKADDVILGVNGRPVAQWDEITEYIQEDAPKGPINISFNRGSELGLQVQIVPELLKDRYIIGIGNAPPIRVYDPAKAVRVGVGVSYKMLTFMGKFLGQLLTGNSPIPVKDTLGGPVQIVDISNHVYKQGGLEGLLGLAAALSLNLAIMNILPIPVVDGGHIFFLLLAAVRGKQLSINTEARIMNTFAYALIALALFLTYNDIVRIMSR